MPWSILGRTAPNLLALVLAVGTLAAEAQTLRTTLIIDSSSSMRRTDPARLRKVAAELFIDLAREGDTIAVLQFDARAEDLSGGFVRIAGHATRDRLKDAIRRAGEDGKWTDFGAAFEAAADALDSGRPPEEQPVVVFLTDGRCDPDPVEPRYLREGETGGAAQLEERCQQHVLAKALTRLAGVRVFPVGLSRSAPREFLEELARRSRGQAMVTERAEALPRLFAEIHAHLLGSRAADPSSSGMRLEVEPFAKSLDLVAVAPPSMIVRLFGPDGAEVATDNLRDEIYFVRTDRYRFYKLTAPAPGSYRVETGKRLPPWSIAAIQGFDLSLSIGGPARATMGQPVELALKLIAGKSGSPAAGFIDRHRFVVEAEGPRRHALDLSRQPDGTRVARFVPEARGSYLVTARVEPGSSGVLTRQAAPFRLEVAAPLVLRPAPISLGALKPGAQAAATLDLSGSELGEAVELELKAKQPERVALRKPASIKLEPSRRTFELTVALAEETPAGELRTSLVLTPTSEHYRGRPGAEVELVATVLPLTFWERHGGKTSAGLALALLAFILLGFTVPAAFPPRLRVAFDDAGEKDSHVLASRAPRGFWRSACYRIGRGGHLRRTSPALCELRATRDGLRLCPGPGKTIHGPDQEYTRPFRPEYEATYRVAEDLTIIITRQQPEE